jgi:hypothetical protein
MKYALRIDVDIGVNCSIAKPVEERTLIQEVERWVERSPVTRE